ncbi:MAG: phosphatase [Firmicutes bacterium]|nr:phosphatase [Bacillota bacterium]
MKLVADLHVHTVASGHAYSTVNEIIAAAAQKGLKVIAFTDHGPAMPGGAHRYHFGNLLVLPEEEKGVEILRGVEANIIDREGEIDLPEETLSRLDLVWAGLHTPCLQPASRKFNTEAMLNALKNPYVDGIVHPGNPDFPIEAETVVRAVAEKGKLLEINNSSFITISRRGSKATCLEIAKLIRRYGALAAINSDAHIAKDVGSFDLALEIAREAGLGPEQIINTDRKILHEFLRKRGKKRFLQA